MKKLTTRDLMLCALFAALTAIGAFIRIPIPTVPITLQFALCVLSGVLLGAKRGMLSQLLYVALGLCGLPIFAAGGGIAYVLKPSFGYLLGLIPASGIAGLVVEKMGKCTILSTVLAGLSALVVVYLIGVPYLYGIYNLYMGEVKTIGWAVSVGFLGTAGGDLIKIVMTALIAPRISRAVQGSTAVKALA